MTDNRGRLACGEEGAYESDSIRVSPQPVRVGDAAWQDDAVIVVDLELVGGDVDVERVGRVEVVKGLRLARLGSAQDGLAARLPPASQGRVSSTCSMPSLAARNRILLPDSSFAIVDSTFLAMSG